MCDYGSLITVDSELTSTNPERTEQDRASIRVQVAIRALDY